jgi:hypothetical protein
VFTKQEFIEVNAGDGEHITFQKWSMTSSDSGCRNKERRVGILQQENQEEIADSLQALKASYRW